MNIEAGDYIRTNDGYIRKVIQVNPKGSYDYLCYGAYSVDTNYKYSAGISDKKIKLHSKDIIDLIEVGDFIKIDDKDFDDIAREVVYDEFFNDDCFDNDLRAVRDDYNDLQQIKPYKIKSIVTREQFEQMEYKVNE